MRAPVLITVFAVGLATLYAVTGRPSITAQMPKPGPEPAVVCVPTTPDAPSGGGRLVVTVTLDQITYPLGAPVPMTLTFTNPTDKPVTVLTNGIPNFIITAVATGGLLWSTYPPNAPVPPPSPCTFAPGVMITIPLEWGQRAGYQYQRGDPIPAGVYRVTGGHFLGPRSGPAFFMIGDVTETPLAAACNAVTVTFPIAARVIPVGTPTTVPPPYATPPPTPIPTPMLRTTSEALEALAALVTPREALEAIWTYDNRTQRFLGWSPLPAAPNDLTSVNRLDPVVICTRAAATLTQPALP